ncbi:hypothetical protein SynROS8604_02440 [Synechococcus sp. ROS8604]|nr:hypothetical protein SynROS8604_02440 [Synechococcus sp. ROS8604]
MVAGWKISNASPKILSGNIDKTFTISLLSSYPLFHCHEY